MIRHCLLGVVLAAGACAPFDESPATSTGEDGGSADADASSLPSPRDGGESRDAGDGGGGVTKASSTSGTLVVGAGWATNTRGTYSINVDDVVLD